MYLPTKLEPVSLFAAAGGDDVLRGVASSAAGGGGLAPRRLASTPLVANSQVDFCNMVFALKARYGLDCVKSAVIPNK